MALRLKLLACVTGLPIVMIAMGAGAFVQADMSWSRAAARAAWLEGREAGAGAGTTLREICGDGEWKVEACAQRGIAVWMVFVGIGVMAVSAGLLGVAVLAGRGSSGDARERLVRLFRPVLWIMLPGAAVLLIGNVGFMLMMMKFVDGGTGLPFGSIGVAVFIGMTIGLIGVIQAIAQALRSRQVDVVGAVASPQESAALRRVVGEVARKMGAPVPQQIVLGLDPTFFMTQAAVQCPGARLAGRTMYLSLPLCRILSVEELSCIIGHELAHFGGAGMSYVGSFLPIYRRAIFSLRVLETRPSLIGRLIIWPVSSFSRYFLGSLAEVEAGVSRDRELRADRESTAAVDVMTAATALVKIHAFSPLWETVMEQTHKDFPLSDANINLSDRFGRHVQMMRRTPDLLDGVLDGHNVHPIVTHPPLRERLAALGVTIDQVQEAALSRPSRPAISLCGDVQAIELSLSPILRIRYDAYFQMIQPFATAAALVLLVPIALLAASGCRPLALMVDSSTSAAAEAAIPHFEMPASLPDRLELLTLLRDGQFKELDRRLDTYVRGSGGDEGASELVSEAAFETFSVADPGLSRRLDEWVSRMPSSPRALTARATYLTASGYEARGASWGNQVTDTQWAAMRQFHDRARADAEQAIARDPALVDAYIAAIGVVRARGDDDTCETLTRQALQAVPGSLRVRAACLVCLSPRWGKRGSYERMEALAQAAQPRADRNPRMRALLGFVDWEQGRRLMSDERYDAAIARLTRALSHGEYWQFYEARARAQRHAGHDDLALRDYEQAIRLRPYDVDLRVDQARIYERLERPIEGLPGLTLAAQWDPTNADVREELARMTQVAVVLGVRRLHAGQLPEAQRLLDVALRASPDHVEGLYWTGRLSIQQEHFDAALTTFRRAVAIDPGHYESCRNLDYLLAKQGQWKEIVLTWSNYLTRHANDGRAYLERAGAYRRYDQTNAYADLGRACELGEKQACQILGR